MSKLNRPFYFKGRVPGEGVGRGAYRDKNELIVPSEDGKDYGLVINDFIEDFPGLNHLYLRFDWRDIEKEEGRVV